MKYYFRTSHGPIVGDCRVQLFLDNPGRGGYIMYNPTDFPGKSQYYGEDNIMLSSYYNRTFLPLYIPYEEMRENLIKFLVKEML